MGNRLRRAVLLASVLALWSVTIELALAQAILGPPPSLLVHIAERGVRPKDVLTQHNDGARSGLMLDERTLAPAIVNSPRFQQLAWLPVDDKVYAQPLYVQAVPVAGVGRRNLLLVATAANSLFAFDADDLRSTSPLWRASLTPAGESLVTNADVGKGPYHQHDGEGKNIEGSIGIIGTPVVDRARMRVFVVARTKSGTRFIQRLHSLDVRTGIENGGWPVAIDAQFPGFPGNGSLIVQFNPRTQNQRPALALWQRPTRSEEPVVLIAYGSHADGPPYHGWIIAYDAGTRQQLGAFCTTPLKDESRIDHLSVTGALPDDSGGGAVWQAGQGPAIDASGFIYVMTGNGPFDPGAGNYGSTLLKLAFNPAARRFSVSDYFTPRNWQHLNTWDADIGAAGPLVASSLGMVIGGGKEGWLYTLPIDRLGNLERVDHDSGTGFQATFPGSLPKMGHIHGSPIAWTSARDGTLVYLWGEKDVLRAYRFRPSTGHFDPSNAIHADGRDNLNTDNCAFLDTCMPGAMLSLSSYGARSESGVVWANLPYEGNALEKVVAGRLVAFRAAPSGNTIDELWRSDRIPPHASASRRNPAPKLFLFAKYSYPTIANGRVYLPTFSNAVLVFGVKD